MSALLQAELLKLRTTRTFAALVAAALVLSLLVVVLVANLGGDFTADEVRDLFTADFTGLFIILLGVIGMAGEWRHRTITSTVLAAPDRIRLLGAKMLAYAAAGALLSLIVTLSIMLVGSIILSARDEETAAVADLVDVLWRNLLVAALVGALGVGIGAVVRNQVAAIVGVLFVAFVLEPTLLGLLPDYGRFGPTQGAPGGIIGAAGFEEEDADELLAPGVATLVMLGWIGALFAAGAARLRGSDLV
ncbi:MAG TPA: ABC transporter permease [Solirubrobacteraceae bacterium]|nr:ABC transporter permease [Solirubrobacteraceae bacterium]